MLHTCNFILLKISFFMLFSFRTSSNNGICMKLHFIFLKKVTYKLGKKSGLSTNIGNDKSFGLSTSFFPHKCLSQNYTILLWIFIIVSNTRNTLLLCFWNLSHHQWQQGSSLKYTALSPFLKVFDSLGFPGSFVTMTPSDSYDQTSLEKNGIVQDPHFTDKETETWASTVNCQCYLARAEMKC